MHIACPITKLEHMKHLIECGANEFYTGILRHCKKNNIWTHLFFMCGLPFQKPSDVLQDIIFIKKHRQIIDSVLVNRFQLQVGSEIYHNPKKYGINKVMYRLAACKRDVPCLPNKTKVINLQFLTFKKYLNKIKVMNLEAEQYLSFLFNENLKKRVIEESKKSFIGSTDAFLGICKKFSIK